MEIVNGYACRDCTDAAYAKKNINPAHPKDGPFGVDSPENLAKAKQTQAVTFGGSLAGLAAADPLAATSAGRALDLRV